MIYVIASNNKKKVAELKRILVPLGLVAKTPAELGVTLDEVEETGQTFRENAELKAVAAMKKTGFAAIADDSGLCVDALGGKPGVYSARYADTDEEKIGRVVAELNELGGADRSAHFTCVICLAYPDGRRLFVEGRCDGEIGFAPRGTGGFGYDPIFFVDGNKTFAELTDTQKDAMSHRGRALRKLNDILTEEMSKEKGV